MPSGFSSTRVRQLLLLLTNCCCKAPDLMSHSFICASLICVHIPAIQHAQKCQQANKQASRQSKKANQSKASWRGRGVPLTRPSIKRSGQQKPSIPVHIQTLSHLVLAFAAFLGTCVGVVLFLILYILASLT